MQIVCVSRGSYSNGRAFAERLATKLGCACLGREELLDQAATAGIAAGKLEMACLKPRGLNERMMLEREHFQAFATQQLVERALDGPLVYHGRTGHLLLQGVSHVLRLRVVADMETRIKSVEERLGLERDKARRYIEQVEDDRRRWVRTFYNLDWDASTGYDFIVNLEHTSAENTAAAFCAVVQLPEFRETPAARRTLEDLLLAARCRVALAKDDRTYKASFRVQATNGVVSVTYQPQHAAVAEAISRVLEPVPGISRLLCTVASTRILWIQERFDVKGESFAEVMQLAGRWDAAVELLRIKATDAPAIIERAPQGTDSVRFSERASTGGIEDDVEEEESKAAPEANGQDTSGMEETFTELVQAGRAGGRTTVLGNPGDVLAAIDRTTSYSLVVVGDAFLDKGKAARIRLTRELGRTLNDHLKVPVIQAEELREEYLFGPKQMIYLLMMLAFTFGVYYLVFANQETVLEILTRKDLRIAATAGVTALVPIVAYVYGNAAHYLLKLIKME